MNGGAATALIGIGAAITVLAFGSASSMRLRAFARSVRDAVTTTVEGQLADAFIFVDAGRVLRVSAVIAAVVLLFAGWARLPIVASALLAVSLLVVPRFALARLRQRRQMTLLGQLPDAMQSLAALLRAGQSLGQALATLAETQPRPLRDEWQLLLRRLRLGESPDRLFEQLPLRIEAPESRLLATTVRVSLDLGGSLAEALENLSASTRRRIEMQERIRALTAQGRLQGVIVGLLPIFLLVVLTVMDRDAMSLLWSRPAGYGALAVIVALEIGGFVLIRRIVRIDV